MLYRLSWLSLALPVLVAVPAAWAEVTFQCPEPDSIQQTTIPHSVNCAGKPSSSSGSDDGKEVAVTEHGRGTFEVKVAPEEVAEEVAANRGEVTRGRSGPDRERGWGRG